MSSKTKYYTLREAAALCGYDRPNTFREKFLTTETNQEALGAQYDHKGKLILEQVPVEAFKEDLEDDRKNRGNWRQKNLGDWAKKGKRPNRPSSPED